MGGWVVESAGNKDNSAQLYYFTTFITDYSIAEVNCNFNFNPPGIVDEPQPKPQLQIQLQRQLQLQLYNFKLNLNLAQLSFSL